MTSTRRGIQWFLLVVFTLGGFAIAQSASSSDDPVLRAMRAEMERSKARLKLENMAAPFYIDYRVTDMDEFIAEASFGALRSNVRTRLRFLRVVVRVGDYKQDSFYGQGEGEVAIMPLDNDELALRHQIWLATDKAYKSATEALAQKQAQLKQFNVDQNFDDFAHAAPVQLVAPLVKLQMDQGPWLKLIQDASALYRTDPELQTCSSQLQFQAINRYFVSSESSAVRTGQTLYQVLVSGTTQAPDGMRLERVNGFTVPDIKDLPSQKDFLAFAAKVFGTLRELRKAPVVDEEYRGPVVFGADAATGAFGELIGENVLGIRPPLGQPARAKSAFATSYKSKVLPDFLTVVDDPTISSVDGHPLLGHYEVDDEGVKAQKVTVIENGKLENFLVGRLSIRDFPVSNGHGRARVPFNAPGPSLGNLIVRSSQSVAPAELKSKMIEMCRQRDLPYGYYVETLGPQRSPRLLYRVWAKDGREELMRGAIFGDLDTRTMRNDIIAAGNDLFADNLPLNIPHSIASPSILFDELEVKRADANKDTLPEYPAPPLSPAKSGATK